MKKVIRAFGIAVFFSCLHMCFLACSTKNSSFTIDGFSSSPVDEGGGGCFFNKPGKEKLQLFAKSEDSIAYVSLKGKITKFKLSKSTWKENSDSSYNFIEEYDNEEYKLVIEMKAAPSPVIVDTGDYYEGVMTVRNKKGKILSEKIVGWCGC